MLDEVGGVVDLKEEGWGGVGSIRDDLRGGGKVGEKHEHLGKWDEELLVGLLRDEKKLRWGEKLLVGREESVECDSRGRRETKVSSQRSRW